MTRFVKFCPKQFNIFCGCDTLQLGTLEYYRDHFEVGLADGTEGMDGIITQWLNLSMAEGDTRKAIEPFFGATSPDVTIHNIAFNRPFHNAFIWCCSAIPDGADVRGDQFSPDYDSEYEIRDLNKFAEALCAELPKQVRPEHFADSAAFRRVKSLACFHQRVVYFDEKYPVVRNDQLIQPDIDESKRPYFSKPVGFTENLEYRFVFMFYDAERKSIPVRKTPILLPIDASIRRFARF